jgi:hypothetical protein
MKGYTCHRCGQYHPGLPQSYGAVAPASWDGIPEKERKRRTMLSSDQCEIDGEYFFILGNLDIPIIGSDEIFRWSVWVSLSKKNYERTSALWSQPGRETEPPYFGWVNTSLPTYPDTINLKTHVHTRPVGERPYVELEPTDHPLAVEQRTGITWERVQQIAEVILHGT